MTRLTDKEIGEIRKARANAEVISRPSIWQKTSAALMGGIVNPFLRQRDRARTVSELAALDDRMLSDIGIRRSQIELVADTEAATKHPGDSLWARLFAAYKAGHNRRATINALSRLPDGLLDDIGIARTQISDVATALIRSDDQGSAKAASSDLDARSAFNALVASVKTETTPKLAADFGYAGSDAELAEARLNPANETRDAQRAA